MSKQLICKLCGKESTEGELARAIRLFSSDDPSMLKAKQLPVLCLACARKEVEKFTRFGTGKPLPHSPTRPAARDAAGLVRFSRIDFPDSRGSFGNYGASLFQDAAATDVTFLNFQY